jgi:hypothetical protein
VEYPFTVPVPGTDDVLLLTEYVDASPGNGNLCRLRSDGTEAWRVAPDALSQDVWTVVRVEGDTCRGSTWQGWDVVLDLSTGEERERHFTK